MRRIMSLFKHLQHGSLRTPDTALGVVDEIVRDHTRQLGEVWERLGAERARREIAEQRIRNLEAELEDLKEPRESHTKDAKQTNGESSMTNRSVLLPPRGHDDYSHRTVWVLLSYVIGWFLCCGAAAYDTFRFEKADTLPPTSPILSAVSWHVVAVLVFGVYAGLKDGMSIADKPRRFLFAFTGLLTAIGVTLATILVSIWANGQPIKILWHVTMWNTMVRGSILVGTCVLFLFAAQLGKTLQQSARQTEHNGRSRETGRVLWPAVFPALATIISALIAAMSQGTGTGT